MKKILVVCGNGIASSSIMVSVLQDYLKENNLEAQVDKASISDCSADRFNSYDLVVSSTKLATPGITTKVIVGAGLLTGIGEEEIYSAVKQELQK
ncbi:PTS sugar transporter subunit IIB [Lactobacillus sp. ESL0681]|uniref:PTS sugar transporter subunit IIB n=1 Tax=Lactobacillus sp. ESL0681 TaxID=2983211 RepID=UPI0023F92083|nr:PTS sugar transporter subunit IIB [Lactobacillus sp. ESL0681]WEV40297.1 PTS sugar transporter subunit IIB [Lactobacillus sp. ESL0681]